MKIQNKHNLKISLQDSEHNDICKRILDIEDCKVNGDLYKIIKGMYSELLNVEKNKLLPNGRYYAFQSGYEITVTYLDELYKFTTDYGVRGFNVPVTIDVVDGKISKIQMNHI